MPQQMDSSHVHPPCHDMFETAIYFCGANLYLDLRFMKFPGTYSIKTKTHRQNTAGYAWFGMLCMLFCFV